MDYYSIYQQDKKRIELALSKVIRRAEKPELVYEPLRYNLASEGKRIRPLLVLWSAELVGGKKGAALPAAIATELFHNFTLIHDDIMDHSDTRRGKKTINKKWNNEIALLAGDTLLGIAYRELGKTAVTSVAEMTRVFTDCLITICEGQALDEELENKKSASVSEYKKMVAKKTCVLLETAVTIGALTGGARGKRHIPALQRFAHALGIAFQIQDDLLDLFGGNTFGKGRIGRDLREGKKTYPLLYALEHLGRNEQKQLRSLLQRAREDNNAHQAIAKIKHMYEVRGVREGVTRIIESEYRRALRALGTLPHGQYHDQLAWLTEQLIIRNK